MSWVVYWPGSGLHLVYLEKKNGYCCWMDILAHCHIKFCMSIIIVTIYSYFNFDKGLVLKKFDQFIMTILTQSITDVKFIKF